MPLRVLQIDLCPKISDISPLLQVRTLEQLVLPRTATNVAALRTLPNLKFISYDIDGKLSRPLHTSEDFWSLNDPQSEPRLAQERRWTDLRNLVRARLDGRRSTEEWMDYLRWAALELALGETAHYHDACREMTSRLRRTSPVTTARVLSLGPDSNIPKAELRALADMIAQSDAGKRGEAGEALACAMAEYRFGEWKLSVEWTERALQDPNLNPEIRAQLMAVRAMARRQLNDLAGARECLHEARLKVEGFFGVPRQFSAASFSWHDWIVAYVLVQEAEKLLATDAPAP
jgi:hypothetical protein